MARSPDWEDIPMAQGSPTPRWPMPDVRPKFATWSLGGGRPANCSLATCQRWHAGIDLTGAPDKALVVAPEDGTLVGLDKGWTEGTRAIFMRTDTGLFLVLGGMIAGSHKEFARTQGQRVRAGDPLARIAGHYGMLHFETYRDEPTRTANSRWWKGETPPVGLLNPTNYVERMVGDDVSLVQTRQRLAALASLGHYKGDLDAAWGKDAEEALRRAQAALGVPVDGTWGPKTEDAIAAAIREQSPCGSLEDCPDAPAPAGPASGSSDIFGAAKKVGLAVSGIIVAGLTAAVVLSKSKGERT